MTQEVKQTAGSLSKGQLEDRWAGITSHLKSLPMLPVTQVIPLFPPLEITWPDWSFSYWLTSLQRTGLVAPDIEPLNHVDPAVGFQGLSLKGNIPKGLFSRWASQGCSISTAWPWPITAGKLSCCIAHAKKKEGKIKFIQTFPFSALYTLFFQFNLQQASQIQCKPWTWCQGSFQVHFPISWSWFVAGAYALILPLGVT